MIGVRENFYLVVCSRKVIQVFDIDSEEKDVLQDICEDNFIRVVALKMIIQSGKEIFMQFSDFIHIRKQDLNAFLRNYSLRQQLHLEIRNDQPQIINVVFL